MHSLKGVSVSKRHSATVVLDNGGVGFDLNDEELERFLDYLNPSKKNPFEIPNGTRVLDPRRLRYCVLVVGDDVRKEIFERFKDSGD